MAFRGGNGGVPLHRVVFHLLTILQNGLSYSMLAGVPLLPLPLALSGHLSGSLDEFF